jgi:flagellar hook protein FlgE
MSALQAGVSGMIAHQLKMDSVGNNIANADTVGYKSSHITFTDALYQMVRPGTAPSGKMGGTNPVTVGQGVLASTMDSNYGQGALLATGRTTDIAIEGEGFLTVTDGNQFFYTRNGSLGLDAEGYLTHLASGMRVVALQAPVTTAGGTSVTPNDMLKIPLGQSSVARATTQMSLGGNLDSRSTAGANAQLTARVYDSLGAGHDLTFSFTPAATAGQWDVSATSPDGTVAFTGPAQVKFDTNGKPTVNSLKFQLTLASPAGAAAKIATDLSVSGLTQLAQDSSASLRSQNGVPPGTLTGLSINSDGSIAGVYSNGASDSIGQIVTSMFPNTGGLERSSDGLFASSLSSGVPSFGVPSTDGRGSLRSGELESSNVNLAQEFAEMITTQRGFQASSRVVSTADQMLQELMNVIR